MIALVLALTLALTTGTEADPDVLVVLPEGEVVPTCGPWSVGPAGAPTRVLVLTRCPLFRDGFE